ncbi:hypothetical protein [Endozoicomonas sp. YOMI1]|uniref:hypothetical protein n=1 Tax=Endozoicomonas sp. YOMI1 TaxID=2828739 RepID=UPI0021486B60|nr:hypothetical protein [Endozoicomonas sp. YOMI1]
MMSKNSSTNVKSVKSEHTTEAEKPALAVVATPEADSPVILVERHERVEINDPGLYVWLKKPSMLPSKPLLTKECATNAACSRLPLLPKVSMHAFIAKRAPVFRHR